MADILLVDSGTRPVLGIRPGSLYPISIMAAQPASEAPKWTSIAPLLKEIISRSTTSLSCSSHIPAAAISAALSLIFTNALTPTQTSSLLSLLSISQLDRDPLVLAKCAARMRDAAAQPSHPDFRKTIRARALQKGTYRGGLVDIVGTGGDGHSTFNVSTTASILAASLLLVAKHGNRASSSTSGSADLLQAIAPRTPDIEAVTAERLAQIYEHSNYAFLFAPRFHTGMRHVAPIRKELGFRTIFNLLGPLANPVHDLIEARIVGVFQQSLLPVFAEAFKKSNADKVLVVCGAEDLDEISCAGVTHCRWVVKRPNPDFRGSKDEDDDNYTTSDEEGEPRLRTGIEEFDLHPSDFGLAAHSLSEVSPGRLPKENAEILMRLLKGELKQGNPVVDFVLMNAAALFAVAGVCEAGGNGDDGEVIEERGPGGLRWKEGIRRARWAIESGKALDALKRFVEATHGFEG